MQFVVITLETSRVVATARSSSSAVPSSSSLSGPPNLQGLVAHPGKFGHHRRFGSRLSAGTGTRFPSGPCAASAATASRCGARPTPGPVAAGPASPACSPTLWLPAPSPTPASSRHCFQLPSPALSRARSLRPAPFSSRAAAATNEVRGRVRRFKRLLLKEAGREIRRCGQNPAGGRKPCRSARCGERPGVAPAAERSWDHQRGS